MSRREALPADYHIHTPYCGHAQGKIIEYVEAAIDFGFSEIGFSDHLGRYYLTQSQKRRYWDWGMDTRNLPRYISEINDLNETFGKKIRIKVGLEVDYVQGAEHLLKPIADLYPFDYLLASIHCLPTFGWKHLAHYTKRDPWPIYEAYFKAARDAVGCGMFDALAHLDFIWRYVRWPEGKTKEVFKKIAQVISEAAKANTAIEINANAFLWSQLYKVETGDPFEIMLANIAKHDAFVTIGSDAHKPEFVGKAFTQVINKLRQYGIEKYCTFTQRKRTSKPLP